MAFRITVTFLIFCSVFMSQSVAQIDNFQLHSHNDYEQEVPLLKAMSNKFRSVEVDVFEYNGQIVVSHDDDELDQKPTLSELYLEPLSKYSLNQDQPIFLMIDIKMEGNEIIHILHQLLTSYTHLFKNRYYPTQPAPIQVILSGSVDKAYISSNNSFPYFYLDGRVSDLKLNYDSGFMPLISSDIEAFLCWSPTKKMTKSKLKAILEVIEKTHAQGKIIRFWNTPDVPEFWDLLLGLKVDLIGVDDIDKFMNYAIKFSKP